MPIFYVIMLKLRGFMLGRPVKAKPTPDGKSVLFLRSQPRVPKLSLYEFDVTTGKTRELLTPERVLKGAEEHLSPEEKARRERQRVSVGGFTDYQMSDDGSLILVSLSGKLYVVKRPTARFRKWSLAPAPFSIQSFLRMARAWPTSLITMFMSTIWPLARNGE